MKYQLVLQWSASSADDYESLVQMEDDLIASMPRDCAVDGHDAGSDEMNIFILTDHPQQTFEASKRILQDAPLWPRTRAAFRDLERTEYTVLWPKGLSQFEVN